MKPHLLQKNIRKFWANIDQSTGEDACHPWKGPGFHPFGYGRTSVVRREISTHRRAYELAVGPIPARLDVLHRCDNPACCNPKHLFVGTKRDNNFDMRAKGREAKGWRCGKNRILGDDQVREIRRLCRYSNLSSRGVGRLFGLNHSAAGEILARKRIYVYVDD